MLERMKEFNKAHNDAPLKIAGALVGAAVVVGLAVVLLNQSGYEDEIIEEVLEATVNPE